MILLHIVSKSEQQAAEIVDFLLSERLILDAVILERVIVKNRDLNNQLRNDHRHLIMGKTKALLFNTIDEKLKDLYKTEMPLLYSVPIVNMDWDQVNELVKETMNI